MLKLFQVYTEYEEGAVVQSTMRLAGAASPFKRGTGQQTEGAIDIIGFVFKFHLVDYVNKNFHG